MTSELTIHEAKAQAEAELLDDPDVVSVGLGAGEIVIGTLTDAKPDWPDEIGGVPVTYERFGEITPEHLTTAPSTGDEEGIDERTEAIRPIPSGVSFGSTNTSNGTSGFVLSNGREHYLASNRHVIGADGGATQPAPMHNGEVVGEVIGAAPLTDGATTDLAWARINADVGTVSRVVGVSGPHGTVVTPPVGAVLTKSGVTTGVTSGSVLQVEAAVKVNYGSGLTYTLVDQIVTTDMSAPGDSGSPVLLDGQPVGMLFAGSDTISVVNTAVNIQREAGMEIVTASAPPATELTDVWTFRARPDHSVRWAYGVPDGDTYNLVIDQGFNNLTRQTVRAMHIDTAEIWGAADAAELELAREQRDFARAWMAEAEEIADDEWALLIRTERRTGRYRRWLAEVFNRREESLEHALYEEYGDSVIHASRPLSIAEGGDDE